MTVETPAKGRGHVAAGERFDAVVVGGGANGLTCAAYLARAGAQVMVLDKRFEWGGTLATDDYSSPFTWNIAQYGLAIGADAPPYVDLGLAASGVGFIEPAAPIAFVPADGSTPLVVGRGASELGADIAAAVEAAEPAARVLFYAPPPGLEAAAAVVAGFGGGMQLLALAEHSPAELQASVRDPRAAAVLRYACGLNGFFGDDERLGLLGAISVALTFRARLVRGGSKALANGLFRAGARAGCQYRAVADVGRIEADGDGLAVICRDGRRFRGRAVVSSLDPRTTFARLLAPDLVPEVLREAFSAWRVDPAAFFTAHFGVRGVPPRAAGEASEALLQIIGFVDAADIAAHFSAAAAGQLPKRPAGHLTVTSDHDATQASGGPFGPLHTLRFQTCAPPVLPSGDWARERAGYRSRCWQMIRDHAGGAAPAEPLFEFADTPQDVERRFRTTANGSLRHGGIGPGQAFRARPHAECSTGRTPASGMYLAGNSVHPGIPGTMAAGYNAAAVICEDLGLEPWSRTPPA